MAKEKKEAKLDQHDFKTKAAARSAALEVINKAHGENTAFEFASHPLPDVEAYSSGCLGLDVALGVGGYPKGRIIEIWGLEASGKTTLTLHAIAQVQKAGGSAAFIDAEHALDPKYATALGVDMDKLYFAQPESGEQALSIVETMVTSGGFDIIVVDSVAALVPQAEIDGEMGDHHVGAHARLMSQALRKLAGLVSKTNTILFFINQTRMKIGVMYGDPSTTTGGNALKFYASMRLQINKLGLIKTVVGKEEEAIGSRTRVKVVKNKVAPPFREVEFDIIYGKGVSYLGDIIELAGTLGLVEKAGAWYSYKGEKIGQGSSKAAAYLEEHPEVAQELDAAIRKHYGIKPAIDRV